MAQAFGQQIAFRALGMLANLLTITFTTRYLGPSLYGLLTTAIVFVGLWTSLTELGIGAVIVRKVMSGRGSLERLVRVNCGMSIVMSAPLYLLAVVTGIGVYFRHGDLIKLILIVSVSLVLSTASSCFQPVFTATLRFTAVSIADFLSRLAALLGTLILVNSDATLEWFAAVQLAPPLVILFIQAIAAGRMVNCKPVFALGESWALLRESLPQTAVLVIAVLYWRVDGVILSIRSTQVEVGVYGLAYTLAFTVSVLPAFFGTSTLSAMTHLYTNDRDGFARFIARSIETMFFVGMPIAVVGALCAPQIVNLIGTEEFVRQGGPTLALLMIAAAIGFLTGVLSQALFVAHDQAFLLRLNIVNLLINIALNIALAPGYGAIGAGIAMVTTELIGLVVASCRLSRLTTYRAPWRFVGRLLVAVAVCGIFCRFAGELPVLLVVPAAAVLYLLTNLVAGPMTASRIKSLVAKSNAPEPHLSNGDAEARGD